MSDVNVTDARASLPALLRRVADGEDVTLVRHGVPVAVLVRPDRLRARSAGSAAVVARELHAALEQARQRPGRRQPLAPGRADELVAALRADRDR